MSGITNPIFYRASLGEGLLCLWKRCRPRADRTDLLPTWLLGNSCSRKVTGSGSTGSCFYSADQGHRGQASPLSPSSARCPAATDTGCHLAALRWIKWSLGSLGCRESRPLQAIGRMLRSHVFNELHSDPLTSFASSRSQNIWLSVATRHWCQ